MKKILIVALKILIPVGVFAGTLLFLFGSFEIFKVVESQIQKNRDGSVLIYDTLKKGDMISFPESGEFSFPTNSTIRATLTQKERKIYQVIYDFDENGTRRLQTYPKVDLFLSFILSPEETKT